MALKFTNAEPVRSAQVFGWSVQMQDDSGKLVRVLVVDQDSDGSIERLNERRAEVESIASAKYAAGEVEPDGTVRVHCAERLR